ncbi:MAG TPA: hypothetical protein VFF70_03920, partial [Anaerolineae bacterium]|nr:hypothetical protein [Anaerolineae bacterium]
MAASSPNLLPIRDGGRRFSRPLVWLFLAVTLAIFMLAPAFALHWSETVPFPGVLVGQTFIVSDSSGPDWGPTPQLAVLDRIIAIDGQPITTQSEYEHALITANNQPNHRVQITFERSIALNPNECGEVVRVGIRRCEVTRPVRPFNANDDLRLFGLPYLIGLCYLAIGLWVFRQRSTQPSALAVTFFCCSVGIALATTFDQTSTNVLMPMYVLSLGLVSAALISLGLVFPQQPRVIDRQPLLRYLSYLPGVVISLVTISKLYDVLDPWDYINFFPALFILIAAGIVIFLVALAYRRIRADSPVVKQQSRIILWGALVAFTPFLVWIILQSINPATPFLPLLYLTPLVLFPIALALSLLRFNLFDIDHAIVGGLTFLILSLLVIAAYMALLTISSLLLQSQMAFENSPVLQGLFVLLIAVALDPLRHRIQRSVDRLFFRNRIDPQDLLQTYSRRLTENADLPSLVSLIRQQVGDALRPELLHIYLLDSRTHAYNAQPNPNLPKMPAMVARLAADSPLAIWLKEEKGLRYLQTGRPLPESLEPDQARVEAIGAVLYVPFAGRNQLNGWFLTKRQPAIELISASKRHIQDRTNRFNTRLIWFQTFR